MNGHINNVVYMAWCLESVPDEVYNEHCLYEVRRAAGQPRLPALQWQYLAFKKAFMSRTVCDSRARAVCEAGTQHNAAGRLRLLPRWVSSVPDPLSWRDGGVLKGWMRSKVTQMHTEFASTAVSAQLELDFKGECYAGEMVQSSVLQLPSKEGQDEEGTLTYLHALRRAESSNGTGELVKVRTTWRKTCRD